MNKDLQIKALNFTYADPTLGYARYRTILITEKDVIDVRFKKKDTTTVKQVRGEIIKIGINDDDNRKYLVVLAYNYSEDNVFKIHLDEIVTIININHSVEPYSFGPVYNPDETVVLLKAVGDTLMFSKDGENWTAAGVGGITEDGRIYLTSGVITDSDDENSVPTANVVYDTIKNMIPNDLFDDCVKAGWEGSRKKLAKALVAIAENIDRIPTVYYSAKDYENNREERD